MLVLTKTKNIKNCKFHTSVTQHDMNIFDWMVNDKTNKIIEEQDKTTELIKNIKDNITRLFGLYGVISENQKEINKSISNIKVYTEFIVENIVPQHEEFKRQHNWSIQKLNLLLTQNEELKKQNDHIIEQNKFIELQNNVIIKQNELIKEKLNNE